MVKDTKINLKKSAINLKDAMSQGKQRVQDLPAVQDKPEPAPAPAKELAQTDEIKRVMTLARTDERDYNRGETFTIKNDVLSLIDKGMGADFIADKIEWLVKLGLAADIAYRVKTGDLVARSITEGFNGCTHADLMVIFEDESAIAHAETYFKWGQQRSLEIAIAKAIAKANANTQKNS